MWPWPISNVSGYLPTGTYNLILLCMWNCTFFTPEEFIIGFDKFWPICGYSRRNIEDNFQFTIQVGQFSWGNLIISLWNRSLYKLLWFKFLKAVTMKMAVLWVVALCRLMEVLQHFGGPCCLHHQGDDGFTAQLHWNFQGLSRSHCMLNLVYLSGFIHARFLLILPAASGNT
jgi:hypothetical protein